MTDEQIDRILDGLGQVAEKLGEGAEHIYGVLVRQSFVEALYYLIPALLIFVAAGAIKRHALTDARLEDELDARKEATRSYNDPWRRPRTDNPTKEELQKAADEYNTHRLTIWTWVAIFFLVGVGSLFLTPAIGRFINPEYYALKELLEVFR